MHCFSALAIAPLNTLVESPKCIWTPPFGTPLARVNPLCNAQDLQLVSGSKEGGTAHTEFH